MYRNMIDLNQIINQNLIKVIVFKSNKNDEYYYYVNSKLNLGIKLVSEPLVYPKFGYNAECRLSFETTHIELIEKISNLDNSIEYIYYIDSDSNVGYKLSNLKNTQIEFTPLNMTNDVPLEMEVSSVIDVSDCKVLDEDELFLIRVIISEKFFA